MGDETKHSFYEYNLWKWLIKSSQEETIYFFISLESVVVITPDSFLLNM